MSKSVYSPNLACHFAQVIAARTDRLLVYARDGQWSNEPWGNLLCDRPYAVFISSDYRFKTIALDFDGTDANDDCRRAQTLLQRAGTRYVTTRSGRPGHRHILFTLREPAPAYLVRALGRLARDHFPSLEITNLQNPRAGAIRPPFAPNRRGGYSEVSGDPHQALRILQDGNPLAAFHRACAELGMPRLSPRMESLLRNGDVIGQYRSRSEVIQALALGFVNAGFTEDELYTALMDPHHQGGERVRQEANRAKQYVLKSWVKAEQKAAESPPHRDSSKVRALIARIRHLPVPWKGKAGATDYAVLLAHLCIAERLGTCEYDASTRDIAELAGISCLQTVSRAHKRLRPFLIPWRPRHRAHAMRWRLDLSGLLAGLSDGPSLPDDTSLAHTDHRGRCEDVCTAYGSLAHDLWRWRGLGKTAGRVWQGLMLFNGQDLAALASALNLPNRAIRNQLIRLARYGLALGAEGLWYRGPRSPDEVAERLMVAGAGAQQQQRHARERQNFKRWLGLYASSPSRS